MKLSMKNTFWEWLAIADHIGDEVVSELAGLKLSSSLTWMSRQPSFLRERLNAARQNGTFCLWTLGLIFGLWAGDESLIGLQQQSREQVRPLALASFVRDKILADFNRNVM